MKLLILIYTYGIPFAAGLLMTLGVNKCSIPLTTLGIVCVIITLFMANKVRTSMIVSSMTETDETKDNSK